MPCNLIVLKQQASGSDEAGIFPVTRKSGGRRAGVEEALLLRNRTSCL